MNGNGMNPEVAAMMSGLQETWENTPAAGPGWYPLEDGVYDGILTDFRISSRESDTAGTYLSFTTVITCLGAGMPYDGKEVGSTDNTIGWKNKDGSINHRGLSRLKGKAATLSGGTEPGTIEEAVNLMIAAAQGAGTPIRFRVKNWVSKATGNTGTDIVILAVQEEQTQPNG